VVPVITVATATISKSLRQYLNKVPGKHQIKALHKTAILGTAHIMREVLMEKFKMFIKGNFSALATHRKYRTATTLYISKKWFV
jgi:hypothetical protein